MLSSSRILQNCDGKGFAAETKISFLFKILTTSATIRPGGLYVVLCVYVLLKTVSVANPILTRFTELNRDELPVIAKGQATELLGMLRRKDLSKDMSGRYYQSLEFHRQDARHHTA